MDLWLAGGGGGVVPVCSRGFTVQDLHGQWMGGGPLGPTLSQGPYLNSVLVTGVDFRRPSSARQSACPFPQIPTWDTQPLDLCSKHIKGIQYLNPQRSQRASNFTSRRMSFRLARKGQRVLWGVRELGEGAGGGSMSLASLCGPAQNWWCRPGDM